MPALTAVQRVLAQGAKAAFEYVAVTVGGAANAFNLVALGSTGTLDVSMMPTGIGPDTQQLPATEAISAGALVNVWNNSGAASVRNADGSTTGKEADGFVLSAVASGATATVYLSGLNTAVSGLTPGLAYLSPSSVGAVTATGATTAGQTYQQVGVVTAAGVLQFNPGQPVTRS